jgi:hypothetical protein
MDSSLVVPWANFETLGLWTSLPRLIISRTIWSEWTKSSWSPLALRNIFLERPVGPQLISNTLTILSLTKVTVQPITCVHFPVCTAYCTLCIYHYWHSFCFILRFGLFRYSLFNCLVIDYFRLLSLLCIIPILEMHSSYFDPGNNSNIASL